jgi:DNA-binding transcriptional regulator GbsR (MarR family)
MEEKISSMNETLETERDTLIKSFAELAAYLGFNPVLGAIYALLISDTKPRSIDEIGQALGSSKSSVNSYTLSLERLGVIRKVSPMGIQDKRKKYYRAETNFRLVATNLAQQKLQGLSKIMEGIEGSKNGLSKDSQHQKEAEIEQLLSILIILQKMLLQTLEQVGYLE